MKLKRLLNYSETSTHIRLEKVCEKYGAAVFAKVRLADIFPIENSGISNCLYRFSLQSHFDFIVTDENHTPLFSIEFDGPFHVNDKQIQRDRYKNELCAFFNFPLLRINSNYLERKYRGFDLLSWFIENWFWRKIFFEAQENGHIPMDEMYNPKLIASIPERKEDFPLWISLEPLQKFRELYEKKVIRNVEPSGTWIGIDSNGNYHGFCWVKITEDYGVYVKSAIQAQNFPILESEILSEILVFQLYEELSQTLEGNKAATSIPEMQELLNSYEKKYQERRSSMSTMP